jgi:hypothetical protein
MTWWWFAAVLAGVALVAPALRTRRVLKTGGAPVSTLSISRKHDKKKQAALDAASSVLR